jgi:hypothetical protein
MSYFLRVTDLWCGRMTSANKTTLLQVLAENTPYTSARSFEELKLSESLLKGIYSEIKFEKPSRVQDETLPLILTPPYQNLIAQAHNGSGKTTCFVLRMLSRVNSVLKAAQHYVFVQHVSWLFRYDSCPNGFSVSLVKVFVLVFVYLCFFRWCGRLIHTSVDQAREVYSQ